MLSIDPLTISISKSHGYLLSSIEPRPIAFTSTVDEKGVHSLFTFSFFNVFSIDPPVLILSLMKAEKGNSLKKVMRNLLTTKEAVINILSYDIIHKISFFDHENNDYENSGLQKSASKIVKPFRLEGSPIQYECKVNDVIDFGDEKNGNNLIICEVLKIHIKEELVGGDGNIDQNKLELIARTGNNLSSEKNEEGFDLSKLITTEGIGMEAIPEEIRNSEVLTGKNLTMLSKISAIPLDDDVDKFAKEHERFVGVNKLKKHTFAKEFIEKNDVISAWKVLLMK